MDQKINTPKRRLRKNEWKTADSISKKYKNWNFLSFFFFRKKKGKKNKLDFLGFKTKI